MATWGAGGACSGGKRPRTALYPVESRCPVEPDEHRGGAYAFEPMTTDRRAWAASLIAEAMEGLARRRPVFHVERDFQLSLGWQFYLQHPAARVSLEPRLSLASNNR